MRRVFVCGAALLVLMHAASAVVGAAKASPAGKPAKYTVVYSLPKMAVQPPDDAAEPLLAFPMYVPDGKTLAFAMPNGIRLVTGGKTRDVRVPDDARSLGWGRELSQDRRRVFYYKPSSADSPADGGFVCELDLATGRTGQLCAIGWYPMSAVISPNGKLLADHHSQIAPSNIDLLDLTTGKQLQPYKELANIYIIGWNRASDGLYLLRIGDETSDLLLWKIGERKASVVAALGKQALPGAALPPAEDRFVYADFEGNLYVRQLAGGKETKVGSVPSGTDRLRLSPSGRYLLTEFTDHFKGIAGFSVFDLTTGKSHTEKVKESSAMTLPGPWHPTEDRFIVGYATSSGQAELREYRAADLFR